MSRRKVFDWPRNYWPRCAEPGCAEPGCYQRSDYSGWFREWLCEEHEPARWRELFTLNGLVERLAVHS